VVDDDSDIRELLAFKLTAADYEVHTACDGESGLSAAVELHPDLVVLDWMMPKYTGLELCARLRAMPEFARLPVILLTAKASEQDLHRGLIAGVNDYLTKPFSPRDALERVQALLTPPATAARTAGRTAGTVAAPRRPARRG
jgi:two-component system phosphate regulon response regulator PhoB